MFVCDLREVSEPLRNTLGVNYFGHAIVTSDREYFIISTDVRPLEYTHKQYKSPVCGLINFENINEGIMLPSYEDDKKMGWGNGMSLELKDKFNLINPMMITKKSAKFIEFYYFTMDTPRAYEKYCNNLELFENYVFYYKDKCRKIIEKCKLSMNHHQEKNKPSVVMNNQNFLRNNTFLVDKYWMHYQDKEVKITKKEFMVLDRIAHGKTVKESSAELGSAIKTIDNHIRNMKEKNQLYCTSDLIKMYWDNRILK